VCKKKSHPLLTGLIQLTSVSRAAAQTYRRLMRQRDWLIELERLLSPSDENETPPRTMRQAKTAVNKFLRDLIQTTANDPHDAPIAQHINQTVRNRWWGLFTCFRVKDLPPTNNDHEIFYNQLKQRQRRITGRKSVHDFIVRYGPCAAYVDPHESLPDLLARLQQVEHADFIRARDALRKIETRLRKAHRYQHHRRRFFKDIEADWDVAIRQARKQKRRSKRSS
jgi:hypothetical protein